MKKLLVLLLLAAATHVSAQQLQVYISDLSGTPTNIRATPGGKVVDQLPVGTFATTLVDSPKNGWWRISDAQYVSSDGDANTVVDLHGSTTGYWIHSSVLVVSTVDDTTVRIYKAPSTKAAVVYTIKYATELRPLDLRRGNAKTQTGWVKVATIDGKITGWVQAKYID